VTRFNGVAEINVLDHVDQDRIGSDDVDGNGVDGIE